MKAENNTTVCVLKICLLAVALYWMFSMYVICSFSAISFDFRYSLFEFRHHLCIFLITFHITRASELPDGETLFYHLNVLVMLMALNECAVHLYVIIIEKKESCDSFKSFSLLFDVLWRFGRNKLWFSFKVCAFMISTQTREFRMIFVAFWPNQLQFSWMFLPALIITIANWKKYEAKF